MIIIKRFEDEKRLKKLALPIFIYGRRKTGKTFLAKNFFKNALYFFVKRDRAIFYERRNENIHYNELLRIIEETNKTIIVDEFHRLGEEFLEFLHIKQPRNLVLITSTLNLAKKILTKKTPILGLFLEFKLELIDERDILINLKKHLKGRKLIEAAVYLREPLLLRFFKNEIDFNALKLTVPALVGEIFEEEERTLSERYEGILRAIALGKSSLSEITAYLYSNKLIKQQAPNMVNQYLKNLLDMGLIRRIKDYHRKAYHFFIHSPMIDLFYYLDEKYNFSEVELDKKYFNEKLPKHIEAFFRDLLAKLFKKRCFIISKPGFEVDIVLGDFKKLSLVAEVKWKKEITKKELENIEEKLNKFNCKKLLIVPDKKIVKKKLKNIEIWDVNDILKLI